MSDIVEHPPFLTFEEASAHLRLDGDDEREYVDGLIRAVQSWKRDTEVRWEGDAVPQAVKQAALLIVGQWYAHRENAAVEVPAELPMAANALLAPYRIWSL